MNYVRFISAHFYIYENCTCMTVIVDQQIKLSSLRLSLPASCLWPSYLWSICCECRNCCDPIIINKRLHARHVYLQLIPVDKWRPPHREKRKSRLTVDKKILKGKTNNCEGGWASLPWISDYKPHLYLYLYNGHRIVRQLLKTLYVCKITERDSER